MLEINNIVNQVHPHHKEHRGFFSDVVSRKLNRLKALADISPSQLYQDLYVLDTLNYKENGFFVEFGAADGHHNSNTWLLEKKFNWTGILSEPARVHHPRLFVNRNCFVTTECVWTSTGEYMDFCETQNGELSTLEDFIHSGRLSGEDLLNRQVYKVNTISFTDLLDKYRAPADMDYLSIDTEGSELDILSSLDWSRYSFKIITCEHNHTPQRARINAFLASKGYRWVNESFADFDDWFIKI
jgi:Methyltransferase FkbM domain